MSTTDPARQEQFAALKRYMERQQASLNREMPGATEKQKEEALVARMTANMEELRRQRLLDDAAAVLQGKVLKRQHNQSDRDYSGGGFYSEQSESIRLFADGTFRYEKRSFSSVSGAGLSLPSERRIAEAGTWTVEPAGEDVRLVLRQGRTLFRSWKTQDGGTGVQFLDGQRWARYRL